MMWIWRRGWLLTVGLLACHAPGKEISHETPVPVPDANPPGPICAADSGAPSSTWDPPRPTVPWIPVLPGDGDGGAVGAENDAGGDAGDGGAASGCTSGRGYGGPDVTCHGPVTVRRGSELTLVFADGVRLLWDPGDGGAPVLPPGLPDGARVWVDYQRTSTLVCPFCGAFQTRIIEIRTAAGGPVLWAGRQGLQLDDVDPGLVQELFGTTAHAEPVCQQRLSPTCSYEVTRQVFDQVLDTTPEQRIPSGVVQHVSTARGDYDVYWTHSTETLVPRHSCEDGPAPASDNAFAIIRTPGPSGN